MKWFQHYSDSHTNGKHRQLIKKYGMEGYGLFWLCDELVGKEGHSLALKPSDDWMGTLEDISRLKKEIILEMVQFMAELTLISKKSLSKGILSIPKLSKYSDDYSKRRVRTPSEHSTNKVPLHNTTLQDNTTHIAFERWWGIYSKKVAKQKAWLAFKKIPPSEHEPMYRHTEKAVRSDQWLKDGGQYIPNPTTYLNQERWKDKVELPKNEPPPRKCKDCGRVPIGGHVQATGGIICTDCNNLPRSNKYRELTAGFQIKSIPKP